MHTEVCVIGGGVSGLALAASLAADPDAGEPIGVTVLDAAARVGGVTWSETEDDRVIDVGPSSWLSGEPALDHLLELAELTDQLVPASKGSKARYIWAAGQRHPVPMGPTALLSTRLLSWPTRLRMLAEPLISRGDPEADESVAEFAARRLGKGVVDRLVAPMVAGIYGADPHHLSVRAAFPKLWEMERAHRSLVVGAMKTPRTGPRPTLQALVGGSGSLTRGLARLLAEHIQTKQAVRAVEFRGDAWTVHTDDGAISADAVVLANPAYAQAATLRGLDAAAARALDEIPYAPIAVCTVAWDQAAFDQPVDGFGVLVAGDSRQEVGVLGTIFVSATFPTHAPKGEILLRTMLGGAPDPQAFDLDDQALTSRCHAAHARFLGQPKGQPRMVHITRHAQAIPQYTQGHLRRVAVAGQVQVRHPGLFLTGSHIDGPGVRDCVRHSAEVAKKVRHFLSTGETDPGVV